MSTVIYFVRHAQSIFVENKERSRGLTDKGKKDARKVEEILRAEDIEYFISSPYERAIDTIRPAAKKSRTNIHVKEDLRERSIGDFLPITFREAKRQVYEDFHFAFPHGESSAAAQQRAVQVLLSILKAYEGKKIVIATHGDIMTLMMNHFDPAYGYDFWQSTSMPDIYNLEFAGHNVIRTTRLW